MRGAGENVQYVTIKYLPFSDQLPLQQVLYTVVISVTFYFKVLPLSVKEL